MSTVIEQHFESEHYTCIFNPSSGFFVRVEDQGFEEPFWSAHGLEMLDISITNWCDRSCLRCYRSSTPTGQHMPVSDYDWILRQAADCGVFQVALGGGNPNQHPDFASILRITRKKYDIIPNYTTNGRGLDSEALEATARYCGAVAVSAYEPFSEFEQAVCRLNTTGVKVNVHFVLDAESVQIACSWLREPPDVLELVNAVVFLNYKPVGRGGTDAFLLCKSQEWSEFTELALSHRHRFKVGFDSCMVSGLVSAKWANAIWYDACEAARFSMYISERLLAYPCSFMEGLMPGIRVDERNLVRIWRDAPTFRLIREKLRSPSCEGCASLRICKGGCPLFSQINLCKHHANLSEKSRQVYPSGVVRRIGE